MSIYVSLLMFKSISMSIPMSLSYIVRSARPPAKAHGLHEPPGPRGGHPGGVAEVQQLPQGKAGWICYRGLYINSHIHRYLCTYVCIFMYRIYMCIYIDNGMEWNWI